MTMTAEQVRKDLEKRKSKEGGGGKDKWISIKEDTRDLFRIGPPWKEKGEFWKDVYFHGGFTDKVYCRKNEINPKTNKPRKCIVCIRQAELGTDRSPKGKKLWALIHQKSESLWNVARVIKSKKVGEKTIARKYEDGKFKVLRLAAKWRDMLMELFGDEDYRDSAQSVLGLTHSRRGRLIKIKRTGKGRDNTNYSFIPEGHATPILLGKERRLKMLGTLNDLDAMVSGSSEEELAAFLEKMEKEARRLAKMEVESTPDEDEEDVDNEEDDGEDNDAKLGKKKKKRARDEEEEEEGTEEEEEGDEEESDVEKKYNKAKKKVKREEESEDEDEEVEEEEEED